jgi:hypothetical protein
VLLPAPPPPEPPLKAKYSISLAPVEIVKVPLAVKYTPVYPAPASYEVPPEVVKGIAIDQVNSLVTLPAVFSALTVNV